MYKAFENCTNLTEVYLINFEVSAWTSERKISPCEMESLLGVANPTPIINALKDAGVGGKGRISTYDKEALKPFDAVRGRIRDKFRDLNSYASIGGSYVFTDKGKYKQALDFLETQRPVFQAELSKFVTNFDLVLEDYIARNKVHEPLIRAKLISKEAIFAKFE